MNRHHLLIPLTLFSFVHCNVPCLADVCYKMLVARRTAATTDGTFNKAKP
jgi:hypothetical protein